MKLNRVLFIGAAIILTILTIKAQNKTPSYNFSRALEEAQKGNKQSAMEYFNKEVSEKRAHYPTLTEYYEKMHPR